MPDLRISKLGIKMSIFVITLMVIPLLVLAGVLILNQRRNLTNDILNNGKVFAEFSSALFYQSYLNLSPTEAEDIFTDALSKNTDVVEVSMVNTNGNISFTKKSTTGPGSYTVGKGEVVDDPVTLENIKSNVISVRDIEMIEGMYTEIVVPLKEVAGSHVFSMRYLLSYKSLEERTNEVYIETLITTLPLLLAVIILIIPISIRLTRPLADLTNAADEIRQGNFDVNINIESNDEIGSLGDSFKQMAKDLKKSTEDIENYSKNLEKQVEERTKELGEKVAQLEKFNKETIDRELEMIELKSKLDELRKQLGSTG